MSTRQQEAQRLADMIERYNAGVMSQAICENYSKAAAELRRLHYVNTDLLEALEELIGWECLAPIEAYEKAIAAIAKARGQG